MPDDYAYDPAWDYGYDPSYGAGYQSLPNDTSELAPVGGLSASTAAAPTDERSSLLASLPPEYLTGVDPSALDLPTLRNLARSANALTFEQNAAKSGGLYALDNPAEYYKAYGSVPISFTGNSGYYDKGVSGTSIDYLTPDANASYTLYSPKSGKVIATGSGVEGLLNLAQQANALNADLGRKADWQLYQTPIGGGEQKLVGSNLYNSDVTTLGKIVGAALPIAVSFIPGFGQLSLPLKMAAMAGAGGLGAAAAGNNILKGALLSGATAGLVGATGLDKAIGGALQGAGKATGQAVVTGLGQKAAEEAGGIVVRGLGSLAQAGGTALGQGALNAIGNSLITSTGAKVPTDVTSSNMGTGSVPTDVAPSSMGTGSVPTSIGGASLPFDGITVLGGQFATPAAIAAAQGATTGALNTVVDNVGPAENPITVKGKPVDQVADTTTGALSSAADLATATDNVSPAENPITVKGKPVDQVADTTTGALTTVGNALNTAVDNVSPAENPITVKGKPLDQVADTTTGLASTIANAVTGDTTTSTKTDTADTTKKNGLDAWDIAQLVGALSGAVGGAAGGGKGSTATMPGFGGSNSIYTAKLPTPGVNGAFAVGGLGGGTLPVPAGGDYTSFGMGSSTRAAPTQIPQYGGVNPPGFNTDTWQWLGPQTGVSRDVLDQLAVLPAAAAPAEPVKKAMGGYAVGGPGDGRSDEIPAMLSDGEYVIDAETVALLGNGSNKAGAQALDKFRANIRKHKGRELARGQFSVKAKQPEAYLSRGRS